MRLSDDAMYQHFLRRDSACNGKFLTGVLTTGIYCLPSCPARRPKRENIRFFRTLPEAQQSGLRPCRRCRPDFFYRGAEWHEILYEETAARVRRDPAGFRDISSLTAAAGLSRTALNDLFRSHAHESPAAFLRRIRVEHVCRMLQRGEKPGDAAAAAGFESSSSFHEQFVARTGLTPAVYGALQPRAEFTLRLPPDYRSREALDFYGRDPLSVSESVSANGLRKAFLAGGRAAMVEIRFTSAGAVCNADAVDVYAAHRAVVRMLGIDSDATGFERQFAGDPLLGGMIARQRGLRIPLTPEPWEALAWAIIGQQISLKAAVALRREVIGILGERHASGLHAHPAAETVANLNVDALRRLKFSGSKAEYLLAAARAVACGELPLPALREMSALRGARLLGQIRGIGPWTVQYCSLRGLGFADCLPAGDAGLAQGLARVAGERPNELEIREMMVKFAPHRSLATYHVWASLKEQENHAD
ncbi:MAG: Ada metal-binding domain-containing protein [Bryobacteraceae bacterium]|jgi:AraC family transcriptional regulator of adaptative response / DNA-3-methyladenine glycosylase II